MANNIEVIGITVKIGEQLACLTIEDARDLLRKLGNVVKEEDPPQYYQEFFTLRPDATPWTGQPWCTWGDGTGDETPTRITVTG